VITDQLWAKPRPTLEPGAKFHQACLMFARCLLNICSIFVYCLYVDHLQVCNAPFSELVCDIRAMKGNKRLDVYDKDKFG